MSPDLSPLQGIQPLFEDRWSIAHAFGSRFTFALTFLLQLDSAPALGLGHDPAFVVIGGGCATILLAEQLELLAQPFDLIVLRPYHQLQLGYVGILLLELFREEGIVRLGFFVLNFHVAGAVLEIRDLLLGVLELLGYGLSTLELQPEGARQ